MAMARWLPRSRFTMLRLAIANIYRPGALTPSVVLSLGLGLTVLVTITQIDGNLRRQFLAALPENAPSFFFIDIPTADAERFSAFLEKIAPQATVEDVPMLRGRIVAARGVKADELKASQDSEWVLQSDRGLTYTNEVPKGSKVVEGDWWSADYTGPPLVSLEKKIADGLRLKIGDEVVVNVLGRDISAKIGNMRNVDWQGLGINFVLVFSPNAFSGAPHTHIATLTEPSGPGRRRPHRQAGRRRVPDGHQRPGARGAGNCRLRRHQPGAGDPRRQRGDADLGDPGAGRRARRRPPPPGL